MNVESSLPHSLSMQRNTKQGGIYKEYYWETRVRNQNCINEKSEDKSL